MPRPLLVAVVVLGVALTATVIPAPFTIDENNYLVSLLSLRAGGLTVPGTDGLPPTRELLFFDPSGHRRNVSSTPVSSTAPPIYAPLALPFSFLGWRGLVALNTLAFLGVILMTFALARRGATTPQGPWIAAIAVGIGAYFIEYAQGLWPHMLSVLLITGAALACARALDDTGWRFAALTGFLAAVAAGVRYQNAFLVGCFGLAVLLLGRRRFKAAVALALAAALPFLASSAMNFSRLGTWNPISKGPGYGVTVAKVTAGQGSFVERVATMAFTRIVDYSAQPSLAGTTHESFLTPQPSGAFVLVTAVKKAWLQSSPWMIVPLVLLLIAWLPASAFERIAGRAPQRLIRMLSLIVVLTLGMFSAAGVRTTDGLCFNQRYFCELVPLVAVVLAWGVEGIGTRRTALLAGAAAGAALAFGALQPHHLAPLRHHLVRYVPLVLALLILAAWVASRYSARGAERPWAAPLLASMLGACLAWGLTIHLGDDLPASRILRHSRQDYLRQLEPYIEDHSAVFASGAIKDALGPIQLKRDVLIAAPGLDQAEKVGELLEALLARGRHVFILPNVMPRELLDPLLAGREVRALGEPMMMLEVRPEAGAATGD